jgi:predicted  nucleic acid-binding Zn-ribbon protein
MHPDLAKLMLLQAEDLEAKRLRDEMIALPRLVASLETQAKNTAAQRALVLDLIHKEEVLRRSQESDVKDLQQKIARARQKVENATTTVQVTALEHEISFAEAAISKLEDAELESMERSEQIDAQKLVADQAVEAANAKLASERQRAIATVAADKLALVAVEAKRTTQRADIGEDLLSVYDRIAKSKGTGIAEALNQKCTACQMMVRPQRWNDLRERDNQEIHTCESCGRLLFYDPARDSPQRKTVPVESIAASIVRGL